MKACSFITLLGSAPLSQEVKYIFSAHDQYGHNTDEPTLAYADHSLLPPGKYFTMFQYLVSLNSYFNR